jgi:hypothetical protein
LLHTHVVYRCKVAIEDSHLDIQLDSRATHSLIDWPGFGSVRVRGSWART